MQRGSPSTAHCVPHACGDEPTLPQARGRGYGVPHACGDEPPRISHDKRQAFVFPTHVGMNRL